MTVYLQRLLSTKLLSRIQYNQVVDLYSFADDKSFYACRPMFLLSRRLIMQMKFRHYERILQNSFEAIYL